MQNGLTIAIGVLAILFGVYTLYLRASGQASKFGKIEAMKNLYGARAGTLIHVVVYTILPIVAGIVLLLPPQ